VDLTEAAQRIFKYHWVLILVMTIVGLSVPVLLNQMQDDEYVASARIVMGSTDPRDGEEANSLADTALALATSPGVLGEALAAAGVQRDSTEVAAQVRVDPVGTSGVLQMSVTDPDPAVSASIANHLAEGIVARRTAAVLGDTQTLLAQTDEQIVTLAQNVAAIEAEADAAARAEAAARARGLATGSSLDAISLRHSQAAEQLSRTQNQRQVLAQTLAEAVRPAVIDGSAAKGVLVDSALPARLAVGGLLGLVLGIALAAAWEAWRPTLSPAALARYLGVPLLGRLPRLPLKAAALSDPWLANYVSLAADGAGVRSYELVPVGPRADVTGLARSLATEETEHDIVGVELEGPHDARLPARRTQRDTGIVVVAPKKAKSTWLGSLERHVQLTRQPVIGVITYGGKGRGTVQQQDPAAAAHARPTVTRDAASTAAATS
jgi:capsular polysaccharide biosynthesis protein